jgi:8-oxo-dGTP diphosphatase
MRDVAVGIVKRPGSVLVCQRTRSARYPLKWEFPGGKLEAGESPEAALRRELREELAIETGSVKFFFRQDWTYPGSGNGEEHDGRFRVHYFLVTSFAGEPRNNVFEQIRWVSPSELQKLDVLEGNREAVKLLVEHEENERAPGATG